MESSRPGANGANGGRVDSWILLPPQIQAAAAMFATEKFHLTSENGAASSSAGLEAQAEWHIEGEQITSEKGPAFRDSVPFEFMDSGEFLNIEDIPLFDVSIEDFEILFPQTDGGGSARPGPGFSNFSSAVEILPSEFS